MFWRQVNSLRKSSCSQLRAPHPHGARRYLLSLPWALQVEDGISALITALCAPASVLCTPMQLLYPCSSIPVIQTPWAGSTPKRFLAHSPAVCSKHFVEINLHLSSSPELLSQDKSFLPRIKAARDEGCKAEDALL